MSDPDGEAHTAQLRERPRVMFVTPDLGPGGAERHIVSLAPAIDPSRFAVLVCCLRAEGLQYAELPRAGVETVCLWAGSRDRDIIVAVRRLHALVRRWQPDVVVTRGLFADVVGRAVAAACRVRLVTGWKHNTGHLGRHGRVERIAEALLGPLTHGYFAVAHGQVPYLVNELGLPRRKIAVVHNGVDVESLRVQAGQASRVEVRRDLGLPVNAPVVGIVAVLRPEKDHATFIRAAHSVAETVPDTYFLIVGDGPERANLERQVRNLGLSRRVIFAGMRTDIPRLLGAIDLIALTSFTIECFPYSILEAMAAGVPAVASTVGGLPEMIDDGVTGRLVEPRDHRAFAKAMIEVLGRGDRGRAMGYAAQSRVQAEFTVERSARKTEAILASALARRAGAAEPG